jgi:EpsI family protein
MTDTLLRRRMVVVLIGSAMASAGASAITPTRSLAEKLGPIDLEAAVPKQFGAWTLEPQRVQSIINPEQEALLKQLYSQILSRTYVHADGYRIMLSIAYGGDQREALHAHYPEACYPSQGFKIRREEVGELSMASGTIPVRRLDTRLGDRRPEPVTYWVMVGERAVLGGIRKKLVDLEYTMQGYVPDGMLFRVSSIDPMTDRAFARQGEFVEALLAATPPAQRHRLSGT